MEETILIAGVDDVGGGDCIAGPIVAGAVVFDLDKPISKEIISMRESKWAICKEGFDGIEKRFWKIINACECWRVGSASAKEITIFRTRKCKLIAMGKAVGFLDPKPRYVKTDGDTLIPIQNIGYYASQKACPRFDEYSWVVACASIVARFMRDTYMIDLHNCCRELQPFGFDRNFGRSTQEHIDAIIEHGPSPFHRKRYKEVRSACTMRMEKIEAELVAEQ